MTAGRGGWRRALVTGASSGIGEEIVRQLAATGVSTVVVARRGDRLEALARELDGVEVLVADLASDDGIAQVARRLCDPARPIDLLVNNAGFGADGAFVDVSLEASVGQIDVNVTALVRLTRAALPSMIDRHRGWVLNVSSVAGFQPAPGGAVYAATKAFVTSFSEAVAMEVKATGVKVTALCPGFTRTEFMEVSGSADSIDRIPSFAWLSAQHVAAVGLADCARGRSLSIPGLQYKGVVAATRFLPRSVVRFVAAAVQDR